MYVAGKDFRNIFYIEDYKNPRMYSTTNPHIFNWCYCTSRDWFECGNYIKVSEKSILLRGIPLCTTTKTV